MAILKIENTAVCTFLKLPFLHLGATASTSFYTKKTGYTSALNKTEIRIRIGLKLGLHPVV